MKKAFTLAELLIVIVIVTTLIGGGAIIGHQTAEAARGRAARLNLQAIYAAEKEWCNHYGTYTGLANLVNNNYITTPNDPDQINWTYTTPIVVGGMPPNDCGAFTAAATRRRGSNNGETVTIDEGGVFGGTFTP
ncbi:MAG: type II secretion system protein [Candidatus Omnitrophota bacterium]